MTSLYHILLLLVYSKMLEFKALKRRKSKNVPIDANESLFGYLEMVRQCCLDFGIPQSVYSDNHTIFRSPNTGKLTVEEMIAGKTVNLTQFGRAMDELGIELIFAKTPQAN